MWVTNQRKPTQDSMKKLSREERPENQMYCWEEGLGSLPVGKWTCAESWREMTQDQWNWYAKVQHPEKQVSSWERLSSLHEGELAGVESHREMALDNVKLICQHAAPWKNGHLSQR